MIQIYDKNTTDFSKNGRVLQDTLSCYVTEELNGAYELELEHPIDGKWQELVEGNIIKADGQLFRIYNKQKTLARIKVNARHIFYDLYDNFLEDVRPENQSGIGALDWILTHTQYPHPFTCTGDVGGSNTRYFVRKNIVEAIMGQDGIINTWGGEIERDNFLIRYKQARGMDRGVHVRYGKNIIGIEETINIDTVCTRMMPIGKDGLMLPEKYIDSPYINNYPHPKIRVYEFNDCETVEDLRAAAQEFMQKNAIDIPPVNYKVDFIELTKTEEYKNYAVLERVYLGDIVTVKHSKLGIDLKCKVIKIKKNVLTGRIEEIELGNFRNTLANSLSIISNNINQLKEVQLQDKTALQSAIDNATTLLTTALGGYVLKRENELLIMDTSDPNTAQKVWRWNLNGLGYSSTGINGPYGLAMTMDGRIVADFITTGILEGALIKAGSIKTSSLEVSAQQALEDGSYAKTQVEVLADQISTKVSNDEFASLIEQNPDSVKIAVGQIGGTNLIKNGNFAFDKASWEFAEWRNPGNVIFDIWYNHPDWSLKDDNNKTAVLHCTGVDGIDVGGGIKQFIPINPSKIYTFQCLVGVHRATANIEIWYLDENKNRIDPRFSSATYGVTGKPVGSGGSLESGYTKHIVKCINIPSNARYMEIYIYMYYNQHDGYVFLDNIKLEEGENATAWSPHPSELKSAYVDITDDGLTVTNGKIKIKNNAGTEVLTADQDGNLSLTGTIKSTSGGSRIEISGTEFAVYTNDNLKAIRMADRWMAFYDWEGDNGHRGVIFSTCKDSDTSKRGVTVCGSKDYLDFGYYYYDANAGMKAIPYFLIDVSGYLGDTNTRLHAYSNLDMHEWNIVNVKKINNWFPVGTIGPMRQMVFYVSANSGVWYTVDYSALNITTSDYGYLFFSDDGTPVSVRNWTRTSVEVSQSSGYAHWIYGYIFAW